ncbi:hypothetical protein NQ314_000250, partial [Rhamnusium bicolor]
YSNRWNLKMRRPVTVTCEGKKNNIEDSENLDKLKTDLTTVQRECYEVELKIKSEEMERK